MRRTLLVGLLLTCACRGSSPSGELTFLAVGQGDCTVFRDGSYTVVIDAGPKTATTDAGERIVLPELRRMGVREIDLLILTHPDSDHIGGLSALARKLPIGKVVTPDHFRSHPDLVSALKAAKIGDDRVQYLKGPLQARVGEFEVVMDAPAWKETMPDNDGSLFVWIRNGKSTAVISGDAGIEAEAMMIRRRPWQSQICHVGHHGSYTATSEAWIDAVAPATAVISCGRDNSYGHPHQQVLDRLTRHRVRTLRTDRDGTLRFKAGAEGFKLERYP